MPLYGYQISILISSLDLNWLLRLLGLVEKRAPVFSDYSRIKPLFLLLLFFAIVIGVGLHHLAENGEPNNLNANEGVDDQSLKAGEQEHPRGELDNYFEGGHWSSDRTTVHGCFVRRHGGACAFCGNPSTLRCSRCKAARYCSVVCQIEHWWSGHKNVCFGTETMADQAGPAHVHGASDVVKKSKRESTSNASPGGDGLKWNSRVSSGSDLSSFHGCEVCGNPSSTSCSRCKAVTYCSAKCLLADWRWHKYHCTAEDANSAPTERPPHGDDSVGDGSCGVGMLNDSNGEEENVHSSGSLSLELYPVAEGTSNIMSQIKRSQEPSKETQEDNISEWVRYLEDEIAKSRNEITLLQSERDERTKRANLATERYHSLKKEFEHQLLALENEKELILNAEKQARNVIQSLTERLHNLQIAVQERIAEKRKQEEYIQMVESKWAQVKQELQEEQKRVQCLIMERDKSHEIVQIARKEVEEIGQELQEERQRIHRLRENYFRDVTAAESRATFSETKFSELDRKLRSTDHKVAVWTDSFGKPAMACAICLTNEKDLAFGCGHMTCRDCGWKLSKCPICREQITSQIRLFPG